MKLSTSIQLHINKETASFIALVIIFFLSICGIIEVFASQAWFLNIISYPSPSISSSFPELDVKFQRLWKYGSPNCLIIGSSMADTGINPAIFEDLVNKKYNTNYRCFNMGFSSSMVEVSAAVANSITKWHKIDLIIWGLSPIDMDPNFTETRAIAKLPVFAYNNGNPTIVGFLYNHFRFPWILATLLHQQNEEYTKVLSLFNNVMDSQGMRHSTQGKIINEGKVLLPDFSIDPNDFKAFENFLSGYKSKGGKIIVFEMPVNPDFYPNLVTRGDENYQKDFIAPIQNLLSSESVPFVQSQKNISNILDSKSCWGNETHMNTEGANKFTQYIFHTIENEGILP